MPATATQQQKEKFLKPLAQGKLLGAFALTEPQVGSDASRYHHPRRAQGAHYVLNGVKQFITSGKNADVAVVFAVTDKGAGKKGISAFVVPTTTPGYVVARIEDKTGQRASDTAQIVFENCKVPADHVLGQEGVGYRIALANLESGRINVAAQATGVARAALEAAIAYARERKSMGKHLIEHQAVNFRLADMATQVEAARQLYLHAARLRDAGEPCLKEASMAKLFASEMAETVCSDAIQIHGGYGYVSDFPVERLWRDVRVTKIYEGANDIQRTGHRPRAGGRRDQKPAQAAVGRIPRQCRAHAGSGLRSAREGGDRFPRRRAVRARQAHRARQDAAARARARACSTRARRSSRSASSPRGACTAATCTRRRSSAASAASRAANA